MISLSLEDYLWFVDEALDGMTSIVPELGDAPVNARPDLPEANSAYVILTHCLGVMEFWGGQVIAGRTIERDRDAEFTAHGRAGELVARARAARTQLAADLAAIDPAAAPRGEVLDPEDATLPLGRTQGGAAIHIYEELAQHHGQMQLGRDALRG
ncbi:MAG: hypothetical protein JWO68_1830 [Actinomycetia bacterium]|nr:hypothetical protein [Actinomycetes bacterium]